MRHCQHAKEPQMRGRQHVYIGPTRSIILKEPYLLFGYADSELDPDYNTNKYGDPCQHDIPSPPPSLCDPKHSSYVALCV